MNHTKPITTTILTLTICWASSVDAQQITTYFSPNGGCTAAVVATINAATTSLDVAAYQLTSTPIAAAIDAANKRGVKCRLVVAKEQESAQTRVPATLNAHAVPIRTDHVEKIQHNKYAVIDSTTVITGSFNWSKDAEERNAENCVIITDKKTAAAFAADFAIHWNHSTPFHSTAPPLPYLTNRPARLSLPQPRPQPKERQ